MRTKEKQAVSSADVGDVSDVLVAGPARRKVFMFRQQHAGIVTSHVFLAPPTEEQLAPIRAETERLHGRDGWDMIHEAELMDAGDIPVFPERGPAGGTDSVAASSAPTVSGTGTVTPPQQD